MTAHRSGTHTCPLPPPTVTVLTLCRLLSLLRCSERAARVETEVAEARAAVQAATQRAEGLISQLAELQTVPVLFSDTDVKLARQTYFTSKQNKVGTLAAWMCTRHNMT